MGKYSKKPDKLRGEMSVGRSLLVSALVAIAAMALASSAMAWDAKFRDRVGEDEIPSGRLLHTAGWTKFSGAQGSYACHTSIVAEAATAARGYITSFAVPDKAKCAGTGVLNGCRLKSYTPTNLPYSFTVTDTGPSETEIEVSGTIWIDGELEGCLVKSLTLTVGGINVLPLKTGRSIVAGTSNRLGATATPKEPIAGFTIAGTNDRADIEDAFGGKFEEETTVSGEVELTEPDRSTWEIVKVFP